VLVDVRPAHVEGLATAGAEQEEELDRARDDEPRDLLAVLEDGVGVAGGELVEGHPEGPDLLVRQDALTGPLGAEALDARGRVAIDQVLAGAPPEGGADEGEDPVRADGHLAGDPFEEGPQLATSQLLRLLAHWASQGRGVKVNEDELLAANRVLVDLIETGLQAKEAEKAQFLDLARRFMEATDPEESERLREELARLTFGE
jgi:hypothetical protein